MLLYLVKVRRPVTDCSATLVDLLIVFGYTTYMNTVKDTQMITVELTVEQAGLLITAVDAEIAKGAGTFLDQRAVEQLAESARELTTAINSGKESLMSRIERAVEDYCDACDYTSYRDLTDEDCDYLAGEQQISPKEFRDLLNLENL